ncbi:MAG: hypothetical protein ACOCQD_00715 [archaeon]
MSAGVVILWGRNTVRPDGTGVLKDAMDQGILHEDDFLMVVTKEPQENEEARAAIAPIKPLAHLVTDIWSLKNSEPYHHMTKFKVVANGGTTAQLVNILEKIRNNSRIIIDLQCDGLEVLHYELKVGHPPFKWGKGGDKIPRIIERERILNS